MDFDSDNRDFWRRLPPDYFINIQERDVWRRNSEQKVREWDLRIAAAAVDAARQRDEDGREFLYPHHLRVVGDCYKPYIGSVMRVRTYRVEDQNGAAFNGPVSTRESNHVAYGELDPKASNTTWTTVTFEDLLARGFGEDILQYQQFTVTYTSPAGVPVTMPVPVMDGGQLYGTQGIKMMQDKVMMNRDNGTGIPRC